MNEPSPPSSGARLDRVMNVPGVRLAAGVLLRAGDSAIELHEFQTPEWTGPRPVPAHALGAQHVAFRCADLAAEKSAIEARGGMFHTEVHLIESGPFAGLMTAWLLDPDGIRIEFVEVAYWPEEERNAGVARYWAERRTSSGK